MDTPLMTSAEDAPEAQLVRDMVRRGVKWLPVLVLLCGLLAGRDGAISSAYAVAIVLANLVLSAALLVWSARISLGALMGAALFGFLLRLGLVFLAVVVVKDSSWMHFPALGISLIVTHLGLLFWELRYVSLSLAHPGLKPTRNHPVPASAGHR